MKVEVYNLSGVNIEHAGEAGELVVTRAHPSVPAYLWGDTSGEIFRKTYYDTYPGVWRQGDYMVVNPLTKGMMILGRSDGILNRSGIRFGSSEIYSILEVFSSVIEDTLCIGQRRPTDEDERILLFVKMRPGQKLSKDLKEDIRARIRDGLTPRHLPNDIFEVKDIPYTGNGKKIEFAVKQIVSGSKLTPSGAVSNPESLLLYYQYAEAKGKL
ncbi:hypothetical protein DXG01_011718 [Tephrocybe rancida]|nr:hypothetical protein DXG01_011718 [Tephrocybe rancida]